jgi:hypothetical protein
MPEIQDTWKAGTGGFWFEATPGMLARLYLENKPDMIAHYWGGRGRRAVVQGQPRQLQRFYLKKQTKSKRTRYKAHVVELLLASTRPCVQSPV